MGSASSSTELGSPEFWARLKTEPEALAAAICSVDVQNLDLTLQQHAGLRAWVNAAHEVARIAEERAQWEVTKTRAGMLLAAKAEKDSHTGKDKTVAVLNAEVDVNGAVVTAEGVYLDAQEKRGVLRAMSNALEDRLQMLIQLSAKQRQEAKDYNH